MAYAAIRLDLLQTVARACILCTPICALWSSGWSEASSKALGAVVRMSFSPLVLESCESISELEEEGSFSRLDNSLAKKFILAVVVSYWNGTRGRYKSGECNQRVMGKEISCRRHIGLYQPLRHFHTFRVYIAGCAFLALLVQSRVVK